MSEASRPWSLARRLAALLLVLSVLPVMIAAAIGGVFLFGSIDRELGAFAHEELEEARSASLGTADPIAHFGEVSRMLASQHPGMDFGWRLTDRASGATIGDYGKVDLLPQLGGAAFSSMRLHDLGTDCYAVQAPLTELAAVTLVLDGSRHFAPVRQYWQVALVTIGICLVLSLGAARMVTNKLTGVFSAITGHLRIAEETVLVKSRLPIELRPVVGELQNMLDEVDIRVRETQWFTAGLAHELRSPIQNLIGQAEWPSCSRGMSSFIAP